MLRKILFFTQSSVYGGDDSVLIDLIRHWPGREDEIAVSMNAAHPAVVSYRSKLGDRARILPLPERTVSEEKADIAKSPAGHWLRQIQTVFYQVARLLRFWPGLFRLVAFFRKERPAVLILSSGGYPPSPLSWRMLCAAWLLRVPRRLLIVHNYPAASGFMRGLVRRLRALSAPLMVHRIITVSEDCARELYKITRPVRPVRVYNGIAEAHLNGGGPPAACAEGPVIGAIGNLEPRKGFDVLIRAMRIVVREFPKARAVVIGAEPDPAYRGELVRLIEGEGLGQTVRLEGCVPDAAARLSSLDLLAVPAVSMESFSIAALEAMRAGVPVVASQIGGVPEVVADGETGLIVPPGDPEALAGAILKLLRDPELRRRIGENGRERARLRFSAERMAAEYHGLTV